MATIIANSSNLNTTKMLWQRLKFGFKNINIEAPTKIVDRATRNTMEAAIMRVVVVFKSIRFDCFPVAFSS